MTVRSVGLVTARGVLAAYCLLTAAYCLLAYIPFTYHQVCLGGLFPWLSEFARLHPWLYWPVFFAAVLTLPDLRNDRAWFRSLLFALTYGIAGAWLMAHPLLIRLGNDGIDLLWCAVAVTPIVWLAALDWRSQPVHFASAVSPPTETPRLFRACLFSAVWIWVLTSAASVLRYVIWTSNGFTIAQWVAVLAWSLVSLVAVSTAAFLLLNLTATVAHMCLARPLLCFLVYLTPAVLIISLLLRLVVFASLSFVANSANLIAFVVAASVVVFVSGVLVRIHSPDQRKVESPLALMFAPLNFLNHISRLALVTIVVAAGVTIAWILVAASKFDWGYMMQTLVVLCGWAGAFALFYASDRGPGRRHADATVIVAALLVCLYAGAVGLQAGREYVVRILEPTGNALDQYDDYEPAFRLARAALKPPTAAAADNSFYEFLAANTNIPRSVRTDPVEINLAGRLVATAGSKPNIFIFVIDSLRRDYLSPYNSAVDFTPAIDGFARESVVFQNAFTRYAGTGLSEPSIWAGSMLLHKQYVTPFYPMNALQKLLDAEGYRQFITRDEILRAILAPSSAIDELDHGRPTMNCELCQSLAELEGKIQATQASERPFFAYTQPQNLHVSVINRAGHAVIDGGKYPGFDAAYASRVRALDKCFGQFITFLKSTGLYDNSIVILTSDHGDSLGEHGRWGHAYNVVPEVVRIPLLIHLPRPAPAFCEPHAPSFLVDITPSLYYLLGHKPIAGNGVFGKPLFTDTPAEAASYMRDQYLIASSYGPVYAILSNGGRSLYVADGVEYKDRVYELSEAASSEASATATAFRAARQQAIRDAVAVIQRFYGFATASPEPTQITQR